MVVFVVAEVETEENSRLIFEVEATDENNDELSLTMTGDLDAEMFTDNGDNSGVLIWDISYEDAGEYNVTFTADDGQEQTSTDVLIVVMNVNQVPEFTDVPFDVTDDEIVQVKLRGACGSCPMSQMTLKMVIEKKIKEVLPAIKEVIVV